MTQSKTNCCLVYVTVKDCEEAKQIARTIITEKLAACANIIPTMTSVYEWQGTIETTAESILILKTLTTQSDQLMKRVSELHPYECPSILCLPVVGGHSDFLAWIEEGSRGIKDM